MKKFSFRSPGWDSIIRALVFLLIPFAGGGNSGEVYAFVSLVVISLLLLLILRKGFEVPRELLPFGIFGLYLFVSLLWSRTPYHTLFWGFFFLLTFLVAPLRDRKYISLSIGLVAVIVFLHYLKGGVPYRITAGRASGPFFHPNAVAGFLLPASVLAFEREINLFLFVPALVGIFSTGSRTGFLIFLAFSLYMLWRRTSSRWWVLVFMFLIILFAPVMLKKRMTLKSFETSLKVRLAVWEDSIEGAFKSPLTGYGAGSFEKVFPTFQRRGVFSRFPHSSLIFWLFCGGITGLTLFVISVLYPLFKNKTLSIAFLPLFLHSLVDFSLSAPANLLTMFILLLPEKSKGWKLKNQYALPIIAFTFLLATSFAGSQMLMFFAKNVMGSNAEKAGKLAEKSLIFNPLFADGSSFASNMFLEAGRRTARRDYFKKALTLAKHSLKFEDKVYSHHFLLATVYIYLNRYTEALVEFEKALKLYPQYPKLRVFYGRALLKWGSIERAERVVDEGIEMRSVLLRMSNPEVVDVMELYYLKFRLALRKKDGIGARLILDEAKDFAEEVLKKFKGRRTSAGRKVPEVLNDMKYLLKKTFR